MARRVEKWLVARRISKGLVGMCQASATTQMAAYRLDLFINPILLED
jgi:hypothetical protein